MLNFDGRAGEDEAVIADGPRVFEQGMIGPAAERADRDAIAQVDQGVDLRRGRWYR